MAPMSTTEAPARRRNPGAGPGPDQVRPKRAAENKLAKMAKTIAEAETLYAQRDALIVELYDYGYTHTQLAAIMNEATGGDLTYDAVGRIIRIARRNGVEV